MDIGSVPPAKRRRTSSGSPRPHQLDGAQESSESAQPRDQARRPRRRYSSPSSRDDTPDGDRSHYRRRTREGSASSGYSPHAGQPNSASRSRERRRSGSYDRSSQASYPPSPSYEPPSAPPEIQRQKQLKFTPLTTISRAHARGITSVKFSPDRALLATGSADASINIYSVPTSFDLSDQQPFKLLRTLRAHRAGINAIAWSPVGPPYTLASASDDKTILLWSPISSDFPISPSPLLGHHHYVYSIAFSPKGNMLVSGSYDEAVYLWDVRAGRIMRQLPAHSDPVSGVDFLHDGTMVCSCSTDGLIRIWDAGTGQCLKTLVDEDRKSVSAVRFSPNGKFVVAWTLDDSIRLWRYTEGTCVKTYQGHVNHEFSLSGVIGDYMAGEEAFLVSGSEDGDVTAWDVTTKETLWKGQGHTDVILSVDFGRTRDGAGLLVTAGKDRDVRIWMEERDEEEVQRTKIKQETHLQDEIMQDAVEEAHEGLQGDATMEEVKKTEAEDGEL